MKINFLLFPLLVLICFSVDAQRTISGTIIDEANSERLPFADAVVKGTTIGASSNLDGYFTFFDAPNEAFTLQVVYVGFATKELEIEAGTEDIKNLEIQMTSGITISEVVIQGKSYKVMNASEGISTVQVSPSQLALLPNVGEVDIFRSLQLLPGVSGSNESSSGLFVRGGTPDQNLVLFDGMTVYNVDHFFGFFSAFNSDAVKDVQLFKGAFPAKYGGRLSSVVDLTGKTGDPNALHGSLGLNLLNARASVQIPLFKKGSLTLSGRRSYTDIIRSGLYENIFSVFTQTESPPPIDGLEVNTVEPDFYFFDFNGKLSFNPTDKDVVSISYYQGADHLVEFNDINLQRGMDPIIDINLDVDENSDWGNQGLSAKWSRQWNPKWYTNMMVASSNYFSEYNRVVDIDVNLINAEETRQVVDRTQLTVEDNDVRDITFRLDNEVQLNSKHKAEFGIWSTMAEVDYKFVRDDTLTILDLNQNADYTAAYLSDTWSPTENLKINAGIRATYYDLSDEIYWSPRFSFQYNVTDRIKLKGGYGKHFQFVNRIVNENVTEGSRDFWLLADDDLVKVSSAEHFVLGAAYETNDFVFDAEVYRKDLSNLAEFSLRFQREDIDLNRLFFLGTGYAEGVEFLLQKKRGDYTGWVTYTLARVRNTFPGINNGFEFSALHDQRHEFKMVHSYEMDDFRFAATFVYASGKPFTEPAGQYSIELLDGRNFNYISVGAKNGSRLPAYHRLDVSAHYLWDLGTYEIDFGLSVFNLYGRRNIWYREYDFTQTPPIISNIEYLGMTPNISMDIKF